jgi:UDP-N-acetyl-D-galactosamine dehydrogenase
MSLYEGLVNKNEYLSLVGLGYVGLPIAVAFSKKIKVIGYDINEKKIEQYKSGIDPTNEVGSRAVKNGQYLRSGHCRTRSCSHSVYQVWNIRY